MSAILGVAIGWFLAVAQQLFAWLWKRHEAARESREAVRRASRLVTDDLTSAERQLMGILDGTVLWREVGFGVVHLETVREVLVTGLRKEEWESVSEAYSALHRLNSMTAYRGEDDTPRLKVVATPSMHAVQKAIQALSRAST
jgi:hypothetical protein